MKSAYEATVNGAKAECSVRTDGWCGPVEEGFVSVAAEENGGEIVVVIK